MAIRGELPSDDYLLHGEYHRCECGELWSDSDGGPCHTMCECGELTDNENGECDACQGDFEQEALR
jgi:hypothetical protein